MQEFRRLSEYFVSQAETVCQELMFKWKPPINLAAVKDDLANRTAGFSFIHHRANRLDKAYLDLMNLAYEPGPNSLSRRGTWDWESVFRYRKKVQSLLLMILGMFASTGGQFPRTTELFPLEICNSTTSERGIYVYNGSIVFVTRHNKAKRSTNREFNVVRFLPVRAGHILYQYLVYILPLDTMLGREQDHLHGRQVKTRERRLLFSDPDEPGHQWRAVRLTAVLQQATRRVWGQPINARIYRQLSIGITGKHVQEVHRPFNRFDDKSAQASPNVVFAWQSGHRPLQRASTYGLDGAFPTKLQPHLLQLYEWASVKWHEFIHQPSKVMPSAARPLPSTAVATTRVDANRPCSPEILQPPPIVPRETSGLKRKRQEDILDESHPRLYLTSPQQRRTEDYSSVNTTSLGSISSSEPVSSYLVREGVSSDLHDFGTFLRAISELNAIICRHCNSAYSKTNITEHLLRRHYLKGHAMKEAKGWIEGLNLSDSVTLPKHYSAPIEGLSIRKGWVCNVSSCLFVSLSTEVIERHISKEHGLDTKVKRREKDAILSTSLQRFWAKPPTLIIVDTKLDAV